MWNEAAGGATFRMSGPAVRMKARADHRVPVSRRAVKILRDLACDQECGDDSVFAGTAGSLLSKHDAADHAARHEARRHRGPRISRDLQRLGERGHRSAANSARRLSRTQSRTKLNAPIAVATP